MKQISTLILVSALSLGVQAQEYESLYFCAWDYTGEQNNKIELSTTDGDMYSATGNTYLDGSTTLNSIQIWNADGTLSYGPGDTEVTIGTILTFAENGTGGWSWGWTLSESNYIFFQKSTGKFVISANSSNPIETGEEDHSNLYLYAWANDNEQDYYFELKSANGIIYTGTGFSLDGCTNIAGIQVVNSDWSIVYGCPSGEWYELKVDGTPVNLTLGAPNGCWMWDATIVPSDHIWFNTEKTELIVNQSADSPWGGASITAINITDNSEAEYYNIQGMRVVAPQKGQLYIMRTGTKILKVLF